MTAAAKRRPVQRAEVPAELDGLRLDAAAARLFPEYSRARLQRWIENGSVLCNGVAVMRVRQMVRIGDLLQLDADTDPPDGAVVAQAIALDVVYADDAIAVIAKPPDLAVHPGAGRPDGTLQNALLHYFPQTHSVPRAGLVHRLDKDTTGLLVVALTLTAHARLVAAMARREIGREYDALVLGRVTAPGTIDAPIGRDARNRLRMAVSMKGRPAVTHFRVIEQFDRHTLLRVRLETGRTHQIRVHLAYRRHPIVGDPLYASGRRCGVVASDAFGRQALHARVLSLRHPISGNQLRFEAPLPKDFQALLSVLRHDRRPDA